ncbi:MAG: hypothetical protein FWD00_03910, partial [Clostridiales bacterium]|nr:hypothetical protein [Clostridiales bacterium]
VYDQLIGFIKQKKIDRQIIIVTHNANIVVAADAEEVIVANQLVDNSNGSSKRFFEYRSGSIENDMPVDGSCGAAGMNGELDKQGIQQHICDILEGGKPAFEQRKNKYQHLDF